MASDALQPSPTPRPAPTTPRGQTLLAWAVLLILIGLILYRNAARSAVAGDAVEDGFSGSTQLALQLQAKYLYGVSELGFPSETIVDQGRDALGATPVGAMAYAILVASVLGQDAIGVALLEEVEPGTEDESYARDLLDRWYGGEELNEAERTWLVQKLGWLGRLALAQGDAEAQVTLRSEGKRVAIGLLVGTVVGLLLLMLGLLLLTFALIAPLQGWVRFAAPPNGHVGIYIEMFALYMALYFGGSFALSFVTQGSAGLGVNGLLILACLVVLGWPVLRGVPWATVRDEMGLRFRWADVPLGFATELAALPCIVAGALTLFGVMKLMRTMGSEPRMPSHPLGEMVAGMDWWAAVQMVFVAAICAPVVEEIFFRGALYTHLSQLGRAWPTFLRVGFAVALSSFIFAVVHPQGWLGTLLLMPLAAVFALVREARGSVYPGMVAHMIHNGTICAVILLFLR